MHGIFMAMLNDAVACGYLYQNTLQKIDIGESPLEPFDKELPMDQFKAIDAAARELFDDYTYAMVRLTYFGLRQSEVIAVKIKTIINRPNSLVALAHSNSRSKFRPDGKERMKSKSSEHVTVLDQETSELILKAVNRAKEIAKDYNRILGPEDFIFLVDYPGARYKGEPVPVGRLAYLFEAISTKSGIHVTPHMMRHFFVTQGLLSGISLEQMASAVGHTKAYMTESIATPKKKWPPKPAKPLPWPSNKKRSGTPRQILRLKPNIP